MLTRNGSADRPSKRFTSKWTMTRMASLKLRKVVMYDLLWSMNTSSSHDRLLVHSRRTLIERRFRTAQSLPECRSADLHRRSLEAMEEQSRFVLRAGFKSTIDDSFFSLQLDERRRDSLARESSPSTYLCGVLSAKPNRWPHDPTVMTYA